MIDGLPDVEWARGWGRSRREVLHVHRGGRGGAVSDYISILERSDVGPDATDADLEEPADA